MAIKIKRANKGKAPRKNAREGSRKGLTPITEQNMNNYEDKVLELLETCPELMILTSDERNACARLKQRGLIHFNKSIYGLHWATKI